MTTQPTVQMPPPAVEAQPGSRMAIPFRQATTERTSQITSETAVTLTAGTQLFDRTVDGSGFIYGVVLRAFANAAGNAALVTFTEDAPFNIYDNVTLHDVNGDIVNVNGFGLQVAQLMLHDYAWRGPQANPFTGNFNVVPGAGATAGTFAVTNRVPVALNRRELVGLLGNQDRSQVYFIRTVLSAIATIYGTSPTSVPTVTVDKHVESYSMPLPNAPVPGNAPQVQLPPLYGTIPLITRTISEAPPAGGSTVNHYVRRVGNTIRGIALVGRVNGSRAAFQAAGGFLNVNLKVGDETIFSELGTYRSFQNFEKYGDQMPDGVLIYDWMHDFWPGAGAELGADWIYSQIVQNMQFQNSYEAAVGSTNNSLELITADMVLRSPTPA